MIMRRSAKRSYRKSETCRHRVWRIKPLAACLSALLSGGLFTPLAHAELPQALPGGRWQGALDPRIVNGGIDMVIDQTARGATLDWQSYNIGAGNSVRFNQPGADSVALNRIYDDNPSEINGRLSANGQVYLINRNGILFGEHAQVDVNTLVASTLNIEQKVFEEGILGAIQGGQPVFVADDDMPADATIEILEGADIGATQGQGGRILVLAPNVINRGSVNAPDGQVVLAAAEDSVYLAQSGDPNLRGLLVEVNTGGDVQNLGSIVAERGNVSLLGMSVNQSGLARATSTVSLNGSIRLVAGDNSKNDTAPGIKSVQRAKGNFYNASGGTLTLGENSVTEVVPSGSDEAVDSNKQPASYIDMTGAEIALESGASVTATGGDVLLRADSKPNVLFTNSNGVAETAVGVRIESGALIDVSGDETTEVPVSRNIVEVEARGNQLADSPLQRDGAIRNQILNVDVRKGTPFLNADLETSAIQRGVNERFSTGGSVTLQTTGDVVVEAGAAIDISGGRVTYATDTVSTSKLVTGDGQVLDISEADPNRTYVSVLHNIGTVEQGYSEWKDAGALTIQSRRQLFNGTLLAGSGTGLWQRETTDPFYYFSGLVRPYDQRPHGGSLTIDLSSIEATPSFVIDRDGMLQAAPAPGEALSSDEPTVMSADMLQASGLSEFDITTRGGIAVDAPLSLREGGRLDMKGGIIDINQSLRIAGGEIAATAEKNDRNGILGNGIVIDNALAGIKVASGVELDTSGEWVNDSRRFNPNGSTAPVLNDGGAVRLRSGGFLTVEQGTVLDVSAGAHLDADGKLTTGKGGSILLASTDNTKFDSTVFSVDAELRGYAFEQGGSLELVANQILIADQDRVSALLRERLPDGTPRYNLSGNSNLRSLVDNADGNQRVLVDPDLFQSGGFSDFGLTATRRGLALAEDTRIGLRTRNYLLDSLALNRYIAANPVSARAAVGSPVGGSPLESIPSGTDMSAFTRVQELPDYLRGAVDLSLASETRLDQKIPNVNLQAPVLSMAEGAAIVGDPGARIALASDTLLNVDGSIIAPAGDITLQLGSGYEGYAAQQAIRLGSNALLDASGVTVLAPGELGLREGKVLDAGTVDIHAKLGSIVTEQGSRVAVDAVGERLAVSFAGGFLSYDQVAGQAGDINLTAAESMLLLGELSGRAARDNAVGGSLSVSLDPASRAVESVEIDTNAPLPVNIRFPNSPRVINLAGFDGELPEHGSVLAEDLDGQAFLAPETVRAGGFDSLSLKTTTPGDTNSVDAQSCNAVINFPHDLNLALNGTLLLDAATLSTDDAAVNLGASYVAIGSTDTRFRLDGASVAGGGSFALDPAGGAGKLRIEAGLIDLVGDSVLQGFGDAGHPAAELVSAGDIRLRGVRIDNTSEWNGSLRTAGDLHLQAQQVYPTTLSNFTLRVEAPAGGEGTLALLGQSGSPGQPLSAAGRVVLDADHIALGEGARVMAPIGEIVLTGEAVNADGEPVGARSITLETGSLLSTSADGLSIPFGNTQFREDLVLALPGENKTLQFVADPDPESAIEIALPQKNIRLTADAIDVQSGAQFDLSGGGDVRATEFIPGPGGSRDILLADMDTGDGVEANGSFAILPLLGSEFAPFDPVESPAAAAVQGIQAGQTLVLEEGAAGLPAGEYAILPARYALYGGYLVTPVSGSENLPVSQVSTRSDGVAVLTGHYGFAGSDIADTRSLGFAIEDGARVRLRAEYAENTLDQLFADEAVRTPVDAGNLTLEAGAALNLAGNLAPTATGGRGSTVDILANQLAILNQPNGGTGVELLASDLAGLNADSLLIGATRRLTSDAVHIEPSATRIDVEGGVDLDVQELILVADSLNIGSGNQTTRVAATGSDNRAGDTLIIDDDAAVALVSARRGTGVVRSSSNGVAELGLAAGATLSASGSIVADADGNVDLAGMLDTDDGTLVLGGASVNLGETDGLGLSGLNLSNNDLANLSGSDLSLRSSGAVNIYGALQDDVGNAHTFQRLVVDSRGVIGRDSAVASLAANDLTLRNSVGNTLNETATGAGVLQLQGDRVTLAGGAFTVQGYGSADVHATSALLVDGTGDLNLETAVLTLETPMITATGGAEYTLRTDNALTVSGGDADALLPDEAGLGALLTLDAGSIDYTGNVVLPSGTVTLSAQGDVVLNSGAVIDVAGREVSFDSVSVATPGGDIRLRSQSADVALHAGTALDVSAAAGVADAGRIEILAPGGVLKISPEAALLATGQGGGGDLVIDAGQLASTDPAVTNVLSDLTDMLADNGFTGREDWRVRQGDLHLEAANAMRAKEVKLVADSGHIVIDGTVDASGDDGGAIVLAAGDALDVNGTLDAHAVASDGDGGRVELSALDVDGDDLADGRRDDVVNLNAGSLIDVRGGVDGQGGAVLLRAQAYDSDANSLNDSVALGAMGATVTGAARADVEAVYAVSDSDGVITADDQALWRALLYNFTSNVAAAPAGWRVLPGLEVDATGDLVLASEWDLYANLDDADTVNDWRYGRSNDLPGYLTLRAQGDLTLNESLSDGFVDDAFILGSTVGSGEMLYQRLGLLESWGLRLVSGADLSSADVRAVRADGQGDLRLAADRVIRTGSGDIEIAAAGDINIAGDAAIYTSGLSGGMGNLADVEILLGAYQNFDFLQSDPFVNATGEDFLLAYLNKGQFPVNGGDVRIEAWGDLTGQADNVRVSDWQPRIAGDLTAPVQVSGQVLNVPTYWAIAFDRFHNGIGALGGGDVSVHVGGDMRDLAIALPTTGKPEQVDILSNTASELVFAAGQETTVFGGGDLVLDVGGDLTGGAIQVDRGTGRVRVGGQFGGDSATQSTYFAVADTQLDIATRGAATLGGVFNSTALAQPDNLATLAAVYSGGNDVFDPLFFTYSRDSEVSLTALAGDVLLLDPGPAGGTLDLYPASLRVRSLQGNIGFSGHLQTYPSPMGQLELLAEGDILHTNPSGANYLIQSDADAGLLPSMTNPVVDRGQGGENLVGDILAQFLTPPNPDSEGADALGRSFHAAEPVHAGDSRQNLIVSRTGNILGKTAPRNVWQLYLAKQTVISAGQDIRNMAVSIQHSRETDVSVISASGSVIQALTRAEGTGALDASRKIVEIAGPGRLDVVAGGDVNLGTSRGIVSVGDTINPALADDGAGITVMAGLAESPDYAAFIKTYLEDSSLYLSDLNAYLAGRGIAANGDPVGVFSALPELEQRGLIHTIVFSELKAGGDEGVATGDYSRGFTAISTLFPNRASTGDITTPVSVIKTVDGGGIELLAPYGDINAGATFRAIEKPSDELGVITGRGGDIDIFLDGDLQVNRERVIALQSDLLVWSSNGSIDAGKGAKSIVSVPDPIVTFDNNGNVIVIFPPAVEGSGLSAVNGYLFAPHGAINAGDAGIRASGNLTIGAVEVIGADNIDVGGVAVGVPAETTSVDIPLVDTGALTDSATSLAEESTSGVGDENPAADTPLGILSVNVMGFGDCPADNPDCRQ